MYRLISCLLCATVLLAADPAALVGAGKTESWKAINPKEAPGGKIELTGAADGITMAYDFSGGGSYLGMRFMAPVPADTAGISMTLTSDADVTMKFRLVTADGRTFSGCQTKLKSGAPTAIVLPTDKEWTEAWGGPAAGTKTPQSAIKQFAIIAFKDKKGEKLAGKVVISGLKTVIK
jgi:hypothetical protein